jgi:tetratricopeptide (TPR) repeat protein
MSEYSGDFEDEVYVEGPTSLPVPYLDKENVDNHLYVDNNEDEDNTLIKKVGLNHRHEKNDNLGQRTTQIEDGVKEPESYGEIGFGQQEISQVSFRLGDGSIVSNGVDALPNYEQNALLGGSIATLGADSIGLTHDIVYSGDANQYHLWHKSRGGMTTWIETNAAVNITTQCDILCSTNTVINFVADKVEFPLKDVMGVLPYKSRRNKRLGTWKKGETPWQTLKMTEGKVNRNEVLKQEREEFMIKLKYEQDEREMIRQFFASRIQALFRGMISRKVNGDRRRFKPIPYILRKKPRYRVVPSVVQDELCILATILKLEPIPGLSLISRGKASKRMKKIQYAAALRMQKFFSMVSNRAKCCRIMDYKRYMRLHGASKTISRFFKSLKMRTFASRCRLEKQERAVVVLQNCARIFMSNARVRRMRRLVVRSRRERDASIIIQRSMKRKFSNASNTRIEAIAILEKHLINEIVDDTINACTAERRLELTVDFAYDAAVEIVVEDEIANIVHIEEEARVAIELQKMEEEMRIREKERLKLEEEIRKREAEEQREKEREARAASDAKKSAANTSTGEIMNAVTSLVSNICDIAINEAIAKSPDAKNSKSQSFAFESPKSSIMPVATLRETASELSSFYIAEAVVSSRTQTPELRKARKHTAGVLESVSSKLSARSSYALSPLEILFDDCESISNMISSRNYDNANDMISKVETALLKSDQFNESSTKLVLDLIYSRVLMFKGSCMMIQNADYNSTMKHYQKAQEHSLCVFPQNNHPWYLSIQNAVAVCLYRQGKYSDAKIAFEKLVSIHESMLVVDTIQEGMNSHIWLSVKAAGDTNSRIASKAQTLIDQSNMLLGLGMYKESKETLKLASSLIEAPQLDTPRDSITDLQINLLKAQANWELTLDYTIDTNEGSHIENLLDMQRYRYESKIFEQPEEKHDRHPALSSTLIRVIKSQIQHCHIHDTEYFLKRVLDMNKMYLDENNLSYTYALHVSALVQHANGSFVTAMETAQKVLNIRKKILGTTNHILIAESLQFLGAIYVDLCNPKAAKEVLDEVLNMQLSIYNNNEFHISILDTKYIYGKLLLLNGEFEKSLETHNNITEYFEQNAKLLSYNDTDAIPCLLYYACKIEISRVLCQLSKFDECKSLLASTGRELTLMTGGEHRLVVDSILVLAKCMNGLHKYSDAEKIASKALSVSTFIYGEYHPLNSDIYYVMAEGKRNHGYFTEANQKNQIGMSICTSSYTPRSPHFSQSMYMRAQLACDIGNYDEANILFEQALNDVKESLGDQSYQYAEILSSYGSCQLLCGKNDIAANYIKRAMTIVQNVYGSNSVANAELMRSYALIQIKSGDSTSIGQAYAVLKEAVVPLQQQLLGDTHPSTLFSCALQGLSARMLETPRDDPTDMDEDSQVYQNAIDDALDIFDKVVGLSDEHPWVKILGGFLDDYSGDTIELDNTQSMCSTLTPAYTVNLGKADETPPATPTGTRTHPDEDSPLVEDNTP